ncbi:(Fe-S)-binding protein [Clostridiaceae bacterium 35-E11]
MKPSILSKELAQKLTKEAQKCVGCKLCMKNCPMLEAFCDAPKELLSNIVKENKIDPKIPYSCALCGYCTQVCPKAVDLKEDFLALRKHVVSRNQGVPKSLKAGAVKFHQAHSFSKRFTGKARSDTHGDKSMIFFPGCSLMAYNPQIVMKTYAYLKERLGSIGILLKCCGNPTYTMGEENKFIKYYGGLQQDFDEMQVEEVIVACQNCFQTIGRNSSDIKVTSLWEVIGRLGVPEEVKNIGRTIEIPFALHDPCPTRNENKIHESVRRIVDALGMKIEEFPFAKDQTLCCGSGAMIGVTNPSLATAQMKKRAQQTNCEYILTYCEECVTSMKRGGKKSIHILDLLFDKEIYKNLHFDQKSKNTLQKWMNRYKGKRMIEKRKFLEK